jgi:hypothetical protein
MLVAGQEGLKGRKLLPDLFGSWAAADCFVQLDAGVVLPTAIGLAHRRSGLGSGVGHESFSFRAEVARDHQV